MRYFINPKTGAARFVSDYLEPSEDEIEKEVVTDPDDDVLTVIDPDDDVEETTTHSIDPYDV